MKKFNAGKDRKFGGSGFKKRDDNRGGGRGGFGGRRSEMHQAVCTQCGSKCEVPFRPTGNKPVFCDACFRGNDNRESKRSNDRGSVRPQFGEKKMFSVVCDECGKDCEVPFRPTGDKPIYCSNCFAASGEDRSSSRSENRRPESRQADDQLAAINAKLEEILQLLKPVTKTTKVTKEVTAPKLEKKTVKAVKVEKKPAKAAKKVVKKAAKK